jgi:hypothetical protein
LHCFLLLFFNMHCFLYCYCLSSSNGWRLSSTSHLLSSLGMTPVDTYSYPLY